MEPNPPTNAYPIGYLRGFDLKNMAKYVDWFNVMSYDIHGTWDGHSAWTKEVINPHTNLTGKCIIGISFECLG